MLEWKHAENDKHFYAESNTYPYGKFRIHYDDTMYWPSWSPDCSQDLEMLKMEAQSIHNSFKKNHLQ